MQVSPPATWFRTTGFGGERPVQATTLNGPDTFRHGHSATAG